MSQDIDFTESNETLPTSYEEKLLKAYEELNMRLQQRSKQLLEEKQNENISNPSHKIQFEPKRDRSTY